MENKGKSIYAMGFFTQKDIEIIRDEIHIGDMLEIKRSNSYTSFMGESINSVIIGRVVEKYPNYCILRTERGFNETVQWIDLLLHRKRLQEKDTYND